MVIAFIHNGKAFLPALHAYINFFSKFDITLLTCSSKELTHINCDVEWHFMGLDQKRKTGAIKIHDYSSSSTPPFARLKNKLKVQLNTKPDYRLFPNEFIYNSFPFKDDVAFGFRDVGIVPTDSFNEYDTKKDFDFIYVGEMNLRRLQPLLTCFTKGALATKSILFLSKDYQQIADTLKPFENIKFRGPVRPDEVKKYIQASRFGINYIPDIEPFNQQTSTKLLEYAANKIPIISTRYPWIESFQKKYGGKYYYLENDMSNFTWEAVMEAEYEFPDLSTWTWEYQIKNSGVLQFLESKFPGMT